MTYIIIKAALDGANDARLSHSALESERERVRACSAAFPWDSSSLSLPLPLRPPSSSSSSSRLFLYPFIPPPFLVTFLSFLLFPRQQPQSPQSPVQKRHLRLELSFTISLRSSEHASAISVWCRVRDAFPRLLFFACTDCIYWTSLYH